MRYRKMITGTNWKIYMKSHYEVKLFIQDFKEGLDRYRADLIDVFILPDPVSLKTLIDELDGYPLSYGTQDIFWEDSGPYTGCISPAVLWGLGCRYVFIGHSERKKLFGETDSIINKKIHACLRNNLYPILLVGETLDERRNNKTKKIIEKQLSASLDQIPGMFLEKMAIVYEPVWAIGQKDSASINIIEESHMIVREIISRLYGKDIGDMTRILYGGSVNLENSQKIIKIQDVDGLAITRAALNPGSFIKLIRITEDEALERFNKNMKGKLK